MITSQFHWNETSPRNSGATDLRLEILTQEFRTNAWRITQEQEHGTNQAAKQRNVKVHENLTREYMKISQELVWDAVKYFLLFGLLITYLQHFQFVISFALGIRKVDCMHAYFCVILILHLVFLLLHSFTITVSALVASSAPVFSDWKKKKETRMDDNSFLEFPFLSSHDAFLNYNRIYSTLLWFTISFTFPTIRFPQTKLGLNLKCGAGG